MAYTTHRGKRVSYAHKTLLTAYERSRGRTININQGARTIVEQARFYANYLRYGKPLAAKPWGGAPHIKWGRAHHALDVNAPEPVNDLAKFYRWHDIPVSFNVRGESWHMDTLDEAKLKSVAARLGGHTGYKTLKQGSKGPSVVKLKKALYNKGVRNFSGKNSSNRYNPYYGTYTKAAVKRYQQKHGLTPDGVAGQSTWRSLLK